MKKMLGIIALILVIALIPAGCSGTPSQQAPASGAPASGSSEAPKSDYPKNAIEVTVAFAAGGATDIGARLLMPAVADNLGVPVNVFNVEGGGGWVGWNGLLQADPDGYKIGYLNTPHIFSYLNPEMKRENVTFESFELICNHVTDYGIIAIQNDDPRFSNLEELVEYSKTNEMTAATTGAGSDDHVAMLKYNRVNGALLTPVHFGGGIAEAKNAFMGGHVDVYFGNIGDSFTNFKNNDYKIIAVLAPERSKYLPDIPTAKEQGIELYSWSSRGFIAPKGLDPAVKDAIKTALKAGMDNPDTMKKMDEMALAVDYVDGDEYYQFLKQEEEGIKSVLDLLGWQK